MKITDENLSNAMAGNTMIFGFKLFSSQPGIHDAAPRTEFYDFYSFLIRFITTLTYLTLFTRAVGKPINMGKKSLIILEEYLYA